MRIARTSRGGSRGHFSEGKAEPSADLLRLLELTGRFDQQTVTVVGDFVLDEFVSGEISRVSREAPVLILRHRKTRTCPGGGANAANNLAELGARVLLVGAVGEDTAGKTLLAYFRQRKMDTSGVVRVVDWTTTTKSRFLAGWTHTTEQQVLRVDREPEAALPERVQNSLLRLARDRARRAGAVLLSDYRLGCASPQLARQLRAKWITLDSRHDLLAYAKLGITAATPNEPELEALFHTKIGNDTRKLEELGQRTLREMGLQALVVTRGKDGMVVFERGRAPRPIPIYGSDAAVDVTGAGDTVIAVFTLALVAGATFYEAALLANYAGGIVVMKRSTATVTRAELEQALRAEITSAR